MRRRYSPIHYENSGLFTITIALPPPPSVLFKLQSLQPLPSFSIEKGAEAIGQWKQRKQ